MHRETETETDILSLQFTRIKNCYIKTLYSCQEMLRKEGWIQGGAYGEGVEVWKDNVSKIKQ